jgi:hypothetical protein
MTTAGFAALYRKGKLRSDRDNFVGTEVSNGSRHVEHHGAFLRMHSLPPPPVAEYDQWLEAAKSSDPRGKCQATGLKLRRMVLMRRGGSTYAEIGRAVGSGATSVKLWLDRLPDGLAA